MVKIEVHTGELICTALDSSSCGTWTCCENATSQKNICEDSNCYTFGMSIRTQVWRLHASAVGRGCWCWVRDSLHRSDSVSMNRFSHIYISRSYPCIRPGIYMHMMLHMHNICMGIYALSTSCTVSWLRIPVQKSRIPAPLFRRRNFILWKFCEGLFVLHSWTGCR